MKTKRLGISKFNGARLKALREAKKWDQHKLAEESRSFGVGITQSQISRYENGQEPSGRNAMALARALKVDVSEFYDESPSPSDDDDEDSLGSMTIDQLLERRLDAILAKREQAREMVNA